MSARRGKVFRRCRESRRKCGGRARLVPRRWNQHAFRPYHPLSRDAFYMIDVYKMNRLRRWMGLCCMGCLLLLSGRSQEKASESLWEEIYKSAWAGIYTNEQAARGESAY